ncbi:MAG: hypothetical protein BWY83_02493 [bacterium ADurb.Bin478]|nr:MAG: hypothetical protein BWY83_02493 [bacterium ADurb.Bin478]
MLIPGRCIPLRLEQAGRIAALGGDQGEKFVQRSAAVDESLEILSCFRRTGQTQHLRAQFIGDLHEIGGALTLKRLHGLLDFQPVADGVAERLFHRREHGAARQSIPIGCAHEIFRQSPGRLYVFHEGAGAEFYIQDQTGGAFCKFFAQDAGSDQRYRGDGGRGISERIDFFICRHETTGLTDHGHTKPAQLRFECRHAERAAKSGDGFQFVQCSTGVAQAAARDHGYGDACSGDQRRQDQGHFVAHTTGAVFIDLGTGHLREIDAIPGLNHGLQKGEGFVQAHALQIDGHQQGGHLIVRDVADRVPVHGEMDLLFAQGKAIAFFADNIDDAHSKPSYHSAAST